MYSKKDGLSESCTGRLSNDSMDIMHFNVAVVLNSGSVLPFIKELCSGKQHKFKGFFDELPAAEVFTHNQISVLETDFRAVDKSDPENEFYRYGDGSVVELDLICEYVFNKKAYSSIRPADVDAKPEEDRRTSR